jgi:hypothetical protein
MPTVFPVFGTPKPQFFDGNGDPLVGGKIYSYVVGTTTPKTCYSDSTGTTSTANPVILDARGEPSGQLWTETGGVKLVLKDADDSTLWTADNWQLQNDVGDQTVEEWIESGLTPTFIGVTQFSFPGDVTTTYIAGRSLKVTDSGGTDYGVITDSSYSGGITTITVAMDAGAIDSGISAVSYALISPLSAAVARDSRAHVSGASDPSKRIRFEVDGLTTATTRSVTMPDFDITLGQSVLESVAFVRHTSTASGTQSISTIGFMPRSILFYAACGAGASTGQVCMGMATSTTALTQYYIANATNVSGANWAGNSTAVISLNESSTASYTASMSTFDANGFTLSWTKIGSPSSLAIIQAICFR